MIKLSDRKAEDSDSNKAVPNPTDPPTSHREQEHIKSPSLPAGSSRHLQQLLPALLSLPTFTPIQGQATADIASSQSRQLQILAGLNWR